MTVSPSYPTITITVEDPATGLTTTITGTAEVDITMFTAGPQSLRLRADWVEREGKHYTITRG